MTRPTQHGFTLVEVLVALVLMAIVSLVSWQGLASVVRARDHVERHAAQDQAALNAIGQLATDIGMRAADQVIDATRSGSALGVHAVLPLAATLKSGGNDTVLDIVRKPASGESGWQTVRWWHERGRLMRALAPAGQNIPLPAPGPGLAVLENVVAFEVQAYIPGQGWRSAPWPPSSPAATGLAVVIALATTNGGGPQVYRRMVDLP